MELVGGGSDVNGATPSSFSVSMLLLALVERFGVSRMRDFYNGLCLKGKPWSCGHPVARLLIDLRMEDCPVLMIFSYFFVAKSGFS